MKIFVGLIVALLLGIVVAIILLQLKANDIPPFHKMQDKEDFDHCYDMNRLKYYKSAERRNRKGK